MSYGYVYLTENLLNGKKYIGQHKSDEFDSNYYGSGVIFYKALQKYGKENFNVTVLEWCDSAEALDRAEQQHIKEHNATQSAEYYNISSGGHNGNSLAGKSDEEVAAIIDKWRVSMSNRTTEEKECSRLRAAKTRAEKSDAEKLQEHINRSNAVKLCNELRSPEKEAERIHKIQLTKQNRSVEQKAATSAKHTQRNIEMWSGMSDMKREQRSLHYKLTRSKHSEEELKQISENISDGTKAGLKNMTEEATKQMLRKRRETWANKTPEERAEYSIRCSKNTGGKKWVHNEFKETLVSPEKIDMFLKDGFELGRLKNDK